MAVRGASDDGGDMKSQSPESDTPPDNAVLVIVDEPGLSPFAGEAEAPLTLDLSAPVTVWHPVAGGKYERWEVQRCFVRLAQ